jgi:hypothetical protein
LVDGYNGTGQGTGIGESETGQEGEGGIEMTTGTAEREGLIEMTTMTAEREGLIEIIGGLSDSAIEKLVSYVDFLRYEERMEELEDEEDIAYIEAHKDEGPNIPLSVVIEKYEAKYGPLN